MGVYPCKYCGALFVSVTMVQDPHAPDCPVEELTRLRKVLEAAKALSWIEEGAGYYCGHCNWEDDQCADNCPGRKLREAIAACE